MLLEQIKLISNTCALSGHLLLLLIFILTLSPFWTTAKTASYISMHQQTATPTKAQLTSKHFFIHLLSPLHFVVHNANRK